MGDVHVERLSFPTGIGRPIKKRTAVEIGIDERYSVGGDRLLLGLGSEWADGSLEAKQGHEGDVNHHRVRCVGKMLERGKVFKSGEGVAQALTWLRGVALYSHISTQSGL